MKKTCNILFSGVGGQGIILASEISSLALLKAGFDVKKSEVHGMAQRGGAVVAHLRYGEKVYSPLIEEGTTDIQVSFEMLEAVRYLPYLNKNSKIIVNTQKILPLTVSIGKEEYPEGMLDELGKRGLSVYPIDACEVANSLGEFRAVNMVIVGALSPFLPIEEGVFIDVISERVRKNFIEVNLEAFKRGREGISKMIND